MDLLLESSPGFYGEKLREIPSVAAGGQGVERWGGGGIIVRYTQIVLHSKCLISRGNNFLQEPKEGEKKVRNTCKGHSPGKLVY